jgi:hypothetical protein
MNEEIKMSFEARIIRDTMWCEFVYGILRYEGFVLPALRVCDVEKTHYIALKLYGDTAIEVKRAPIQLCTTEYCYITYAEEPDIIVALHTTGVAKVLMIKPTPETCKKLCQAHVPK